MNEKEQEAIEYLKKEYNFSIITKKTEAFKCVLNLINKLQKENEELKERNKGLTTALEEWVNGERINDIKHISKDKIRDKIKELEEGEPIYNVYSNGQTYEVGKHVYVNTIFVLKELLEED